MCPGPSRAARPRPPARRTSRLSGPCNELLGSRAAHACWWRRHLGIAHEGPRRNALQAWRTLRRTPTPNPSEPLSTLTTPHHAERSLLPAASYPPRAPPTPPPPLTTHLPRSLHPPSPTPRSSTSTEPNPHQPINPFCPQSHLQIFNRLLPLSHNHLPPRRPGLTTRPCLSTLWAGGQAGASGHTTTNTTL